MYWSNVNLVDLVKSMMELQFLGFILLIIVDNVRNCMMDSVAFTTIG